LKSSTFFFYFKATGACVVLWAGFMVANILSFEVGTYGFIIFTCIFALLAMIIIHQEEDTVENESQSWQCPICAAIVAEAEQARPDCGYIAVDKP
jgi:hypothetical protein